MSFQPGDHIYARASADRRANEALRIQQQQEQRAQQQEGRSAQMDDIKLRNAKIEQAVQYLGMATPENWQNIRQQAIQSGLGDETTLPMEYDDNWIKSTRAAFASASSSVPSAIQEYQFYKNLPEGEQPVFMDMKRKNVIDLGDRMFNTATKQEYPIAVSPDVSPENKGAGAQAVADVELEMKPQIEAAVKTAEGQAERSGGKAKRQRDSAIAGLDKIDLDVDNILNAEGLPLIVGGPVQTLVPNMPGGPAADAEALLTGLKDKLSTSAIAEMRASSPTGGAVGNVTEKEWDKLANTYVSLQRSQSLPQFKRRLADLKSQIANMRELADAGYTPPDRPSLNDSPRGNAPVAERSITGKKYSPSRNQTKIIYSDGTEEVVDGRQ